MRAIRKRAPRNRSEQAGSFNRISGMTVRNRTRNFAYPEVWGYIRPKQAGQGFECQQCAQKFQSAEQLRQHEVDCGSDEADRPL